MTDKILKELPEILVEYKCDIRKAILINRL